MFQLDNFRMGKYNIVYKEGIYIMKKVNKFIKPQLAKEAEMDNRFPITKAAKKLGVHPMAIQKYLLPCEWFQIGYKMVEYYDIDIYLKLYYNEDISQDGHSAERLRNIKDTWEKLKNYRPETVKERTYRAEVSFLMFSGTKNELKVTPYHYYDIEVIEKGQFYTFKTPKGDVRKKKGSRGTAIREKPVFEAISGTISG